MAAQNNFDCAKIAREQEDSDSTSYYFGLAGAPKLLARSSDDAFNFKYDGNSLLPKTFFAVGSHEITKVFDAGPRDDITQFLDDNFDAPWFDLRYVRIGYSEENVENPVVVLVTVQKETMSTSQAHDAVAECRDILLRHDLDDVHVEFMEIERSPSPEFFEDGA